MARGLRVFGPLRAWIRRCWLWENWQGWHPRRFEWYFTRKRAGVETRADEQALVFSAVELVIRSDQRVLEVGSGTGNYTVELANRCASVVAVDASSAMRRFLARRVRRQGIRNVGVRPGRLPDTLGDIGPFDGVVAIGVLNYVEDLEAAMKAFAAVLAPTGWIVVTVPPDSPEGRKYGDCPVSC